VINKILNAAQWWQIFFKDAFAGARFVKEVRAEKSEIIFSKWVH